MNIYFTTVSGVYLPGLSDRIPTLKQIIPFAYTFEHESNNEREVAYWLREQILSLEHPSYVRRWWLTPILLSKDQQWLTGATRNRFNMVRATYGMPPMEDK